MVDPNESNTSTGEHLVLWASLGPRLIMFGPAKSVLGAAIFSNSTSNGLSKPGLSIGLGFCK